jgi:hypothetical protein
MRRSLALLTTVLAATGCGGRAAPPSTTTAPASGRPAARPAADPGTLAYGVNAGRYRFEQSLHISQEVMGNVTEVDATTTMLISAALVAADAGNVGASFTVDSVSLIGSVPGAADALAGSRGKTWRAVFTPTGRPVSLTAPDTGAVTSQTGEMFREFLPVLPASLAPGTTWVDTVTATPNQPGMTMRTQSIRQNRVVGWEMHDGVRAVKIATTSAITISGEGESQGQQLQMAGTGTNVSERYISAAGVFLGSTVRDSTNLNVSVVSAGIDVPVRQVRRSTTTRLP